MASSVLTGVGAAMTTYTEEYRELVAETPKGAVTAAFREEVAAVVEVFRREGRTFLMPPEGVGLEPDTIKLDAGIVSGVHADPARQALVTAMVGFAEGIGASVVAEGVEVPAERDLLAARGILLGQGWLWGKAVTPAQFATRWGAIAGVPDAGAAMTTRGVLTTRCPAVPCGRRPSGASPSSSR